MQDEKVFASFLSSLKNKKWLILLAAVGLILVLIGGSAGSSDRADDGTATDTYLESLTSEVERLCHQVEGAGKVEVLITLAEGERLDYQGSHLIGSTPPRVAGVAVLCDGGDNDRVKRELTELLSALFDIGAHRIYIGKKQ